MQKKVPAANKEIGSSTVTSLELSIRAMPSSTSTSLVVPSAGRRTASESLFRRRLEKQPKKLVGFSEAYIFSIAIGLLHIIQEVPEDVETCNEEFTALLVYSESIDGIDSDSRGLIQRKDLQRIPLYQGVKEFSKISRSDQIRFSSSGEVNSPDSG